MVDEGMSKDYLPPIRPDMRRDEYMRGITGSAGVIAHSENYPEEDVFDAILRINDMETANSVSKDTFRKALRLIINMAEITEEG